MARLNFVFIKHPQQNQRLKNYFLVDKKNHLRFWRNYPELKLGERYTPQAKKLGGFFLYWRADHEAG
jgi:hypothetical protein